jgi:hypothetical protein
MTINFDKLRTPQWIFLLYMTVSSLLIMLFRFIFPGSVPPLLIFTHDWRLIHGALELFNLFPALALSALVIPFGLVSYEENYPSFSQILFKRLITSVIVAICCAAVYSVIFFLALPMIKNYEEDLRFKGELYYLAKDHAQQRSRAGDWQEASQFLDICYQVWPESPELNNLRIEIDINLNERRSEESGERSSARAALARDWRAADVTPLSGDQQLLDATQAIAMSETAFNEKRYFDAHWLATLGGRLAISGGPEAANAARLASEAWNMIQSQAPSIREENRYSLFQLKLSGYQAMNSSDWIRAFYIFQELTALTPDDPDAVNFLAASERAARENAFFIDEMELSLGEILTGAVFSLPHHYGRSVLRFTNLSTSRDFAFGMNFEYMEFDAYSRPVASVRSEYAKLLPVIINERQQIKVLTHAISRYDKDHSWEGEWLLGERPPTGVILDISFEDFLLISNVRRGLPNLQIDELFIASTRLGSAGYIPQIFEAEVLNRIGSVVFFLPMAIFVIIIGWRYRAKAKPRYLFILLLPILPVVFHGFVFMYRTILNSLGIWLVISFGFSTALTFFITALALFLFISMIILAAQHR